LLAPYYKCYTFSITTQCEWLGFAASLANGPRFGSVPVTVEFPSPPPTKGSKAEEVMRRKKEAFLRGAVSFDVGHGQLEGLLPKSQSQAYADNPLFPSSVLQPRLLLDQIQCKNQRHGAHLCNPIGQPAGSRLERGLLEG